MSLLYTNTGIILLDNSRGPVTSSAGGNVINFQKVMGSLETTPENAFQVRFPSGALSNQTRDTIGYYITQSKGVPLFGIGTNSPFGSLDIRSDNSDSPADITLRTNEDGEVTVGEETGRIRFMIESSSFGINDITTAISGASAEIFSRVNEVTSQGVKGSIVFALSRTTTTASIDAFEVGYEAGSPFLSDGDIHAVLSGSMEINAITPRLLLHKQDGTQPVALIGSVDNNDFNHGAIILKDAAESDNGYFVIRKDANSFLSGSTNFGIGTTSPDEKLEIEGNTKSQRIIVTSSAQGNGGIGIPDFTTAIRFSEGTIQDQIIFDAYGNSSLLTIDGNIIQNKIIVGNGNDNDFQVRTGNDDNTLYVEGSSDKVGIGTDSPGEKLEVVGNISASGDLIASGAFFTGLQGPETQSYALFWGDNADGRVTYGAIQSNAITALNNGTENNLVTVGANTTELDSESNLTFDGSNLTVIGSITASGEISASKLLTQNLELGYLGSIFVKDSNGNTDDRAILNAADVGLVFGDSDFSSEIDATNITLDASNDIVLSSDSGEITFREGGSTSITFNTTAGHITASGDVSASGNISALTTDAGGAAYNTLMVDTTTGKFYHTGSYGGGGGSGTVTEVTVGTGLDVSNGTTTPNITLDLSEFGDMTQQFVSTDQFIVLDTNLSSVERRKQASEISVNVFDMPGSNKNILFKDNSDDINTDNYFNFSDAQDVQDNYILSVGDFSSLNGRKVGFRWGAGNSQGTLNGSIFYVGTGDFSFEGKLNGSSFANFEKVKKYFSLYETSAANDPLPALARLHVSDIPGINGQPIVKILNNSTKGLKGVFVQTRGNSTTIGNNSIFSILEFHHTATNNQLNGTIQGGIYWDPHNTFGIPNNASQLVFTGAITTGSDRKLKKNITDTKRGLNDILKLKVRDFNLKTHTKDTPQATGFIAQEVQETYPELVGIDKEKDHLTVNETSLIPVMAKAIQELQQQIDELKNQLNSK